MLLDRALLIQLVALAVLRSAVALEGVLFAEEGAADVADFGFDVIMEDVTPPTTQKLATRRKRTDPPTTETPVCSVGGPKLKESRYNMLGSALMIFPTLKVACAGEISEWEFLPNKTNTSQLYLAVWHHTNPSKVQEFGLRGMNNPNVTAVAGKWNKWVVPVEKRIPVEPNDVIGYFYVNWVVNVSELILPLAIPESEFDKVFFKTQQAGVYASMLGLAEVVQRHNSIVDFAVVGTYLPNYAIPPIRATIVPRTTTTTSTTPINRVKLDDPVRQPTVTQNPDLVTPGKRCTHLVSHIDDSRRYSNCRPEQFVRYYYSPVLKTCIYFYYSTCTDIPGKLPAPIKTGNNFDTVEECLSICRALVDPAAEPVVPLVDYTSFNDEDKFK